MRNEKNADGKYKYTNHKAEFFKDKSPLRVSEEFMISRMREHLKGNLSSARVHIRDFDEMPEPMKLIILDIYYNKGSIYSQKGLLNALKERDYEDFVEKVKRPLPDRNEWVLAQINKIPRSFWLK